MIQTACFAGGCFWCITPAFAQLPGVRSVTAGYSGGREANPTYADVKGQRTGHREAVRIEYDPEQVSYAALLRLFLDSVDPFDGEGQYIDRGHSYTLAVYWGDGAERAAAEGAVRELAERSGRPVFVSIEPFTAFWTAEEEHQNYYLTHPEEFRKELEHSGRTKSSHRS